ncbi:MAG: methyltransferase domain-containing protein, partial [Anaerolineales bacterium]
DISASPEHGEASISVVGDPSALPFSGKSFEVVFLTEVVEHLSRPRQVLGEIARVTQLGGGLILTPPLGSAHQTPYPFSGGYTRHFCEKTLPEFGFEADTIEPNGGLFGHLVEMNGRAFSYIEQALQAPWYRPLRYLLALTLRNIPAVVYSALEERVKVEDSTVGYRVVAKRLPAPIGPKAMGIPH